MCNMHISLHMLQASKDNVMHISLRMLQASKDNVMRESFQDPVVCAGSVKTKPSWRPDQSNHFSQIIHFRAVGTCEACVFKLVED